MLQSPCPFAENVFKSERFDLDKFMTSKLAPFYTTPDGKRKKAGEYIQRGDLASTLDKIAENGVGEFYTGGLADDIQKAVSFCFIIIR